jgi:uncharacterized protein
MFKDTREASWWIIIAFVVLDSLLHIFWHWGFKAGLPFFNTLSVNLASFAIIVGGLFFFLGNLKPKDVSLQWSKLFLGVIFTLILFLLHSLAVCSIARLSPLNIFNNWQDVGIGNTTDYLVGQLFGNTFYEETVYRGFLLTQLYLKLSKAKIFFSVLFSQTIFALMHVPNRLVGNGGFSLGDFVGLFISGLFFCIVFLLTKNLFAVMGFHTLGNMPFLQLSNTNGAKENETSLLLASLTICMGIFWHYQQKKNL